MNIFFFLFFHYFLLSPLVYSIELYCFFYLVEKETKRNFQQMKIFFTWVSWNVSSRETLIPKSWIHSLIYSTKGATRTFKSRPLSRNFLLIRKSGLGKWESTVNTWSPQVYGKNLWKCIIYFLLTHMQKSYTRCRNRGWTHFTLWDEISGYTSSLFSFNWTPTYCQN